MAHSSQPGPTCNDPFALHLPMRSAGPLGHNDAAEPGFHVQLGDTPGALGIADCGDPELERLHLLSGKLRLKLSWDPDLLLWDYDPQNLLEDEQLNPEFVEKARDTLEAAVAVGLRPKVHQAYRSPEESDRLHKLFAEGKGSRAAPAWQSCHNYGLAMDVWLYDARERYIDNHVKGWYAKYKAFARVAQQRAMVWGENFGSGDADHFEFHPNWSGGAGGAFLKKVREWAMKAAAGTADAVKQPRQTPATGPGWMDHFWWAAGAGGRAPSVEFLKANLAPK